MVTVEDRFWNKVNKVPDGCWEWIAFCDRYGYGRFLLDGKATSAHRISAYWHGILPTLQSALYVCHRCDNPKCVNPDHVFVGTPKDNASDMMKKNRHARTSQPGSKHGMSKLTEDDVLKIRLLRATGLTHRKIAEQFGVSSSMVTYILNGKNWKHI